MNEFCNGMSESKKLTTNSEFVRVKMRVNKKITNKRNFKYIFWQFHNMFGNLLPAKNKTKN